MKGNILVVDDESTARKSWGDILKLEGYQVTAAASGEAAVAAVQKETFDIMLLDLRMPGMDGLEVLRTVTKIVPDTQIIVLTAHGSLESAIVALRQGAHDYLLKPANPEQVLNSVAAAFANKKGARKRPSGSDTSREVPCQPRSSLTANDHRRHSRLPRSKSRDQVTRRLGRRRLPGIARGYGQSRGSLNEAGSSKAYGVSEPARN